MPKNDVFSFSVVVGGVPVSEYFLKDGSSFIEADIFGPQSRKEDRVEVVDGQEERQQFPVLPYEINVELCCGQTAWAFVSIDGINVCKVRLLGQATRTIRGFKTGDTIREFLFSLPRFGYDEEDKIDKSRHSAVGTIEVTVKEAIFHRRVINYGIYEGEARSKVKRLEFTQATKKDSEAVTDGAYLMLTTKAGSRLESGKRKKDPMEFHDIYHVGKELGNLKLKYYIKGTIRQIPVIVIDD